MIIDSRTKPNDVWIMHRKDIDTIKDGLCHLYVFLDGASGICVNNKLFRDLPTKMELTTFIKDACAKAKSQPKVIAIRKKDPLAETLKISCAEFQITYYAGVDREIDPLTKEFEESFSDFSKSSIDGTNLHDIPDSEDIETAKSLIPEPYSPCPCASGKKFKFCCSKAFRDIVYAMVEAEEGRLKKALHYLSQAEAKVGLTAEILSRYGICWSYFDLEKSHEYLKKALEINPNHPRTNYVMGIDSVNRGQHEAAIVFYRRAIENYPPDDRYHLNETYNNLGTAYYKLEQWMAAKESWEKALVLLPSDKVVKRNLINFIYENPMLPQEVRILSPYISKFLKR